MGQVERHPPCLVAAADNPGKMKFGWSTSAIKVQAHAVAGALLAMLTWWIEYGMLEAPGAMDSLFHRMVWRGLSAPL